MHRWPPSRASTLMTVRKSTAKSKMLHTRRRCTTVVCCVHQNKNELRRFEGRTGTDYIIDQVFLKKYSMRIYVLYGCELKIAVY